MDERFVGKCALVAGGAQGIGRGVVQRLADEGAEVAIADLDIERARQAAEELEAAGCRAVAVQVDLADIHSIENMVGEAVHRLRQIDFFVNTAGIVHNTPFLEVTEEEWDRVVDINQRGALFCMKAVSRHMLERVPEEVKARGRSATSYGKIVNFSSISGRRGRPLQVHYASAKAAVISLTQSVALALAPYNINVNAVSPGPVRTRMWDINVAEKGRILGRNAEQEAEQFIDQIPLKRAGTAEDMAAAVAFLCSADSDFITGQTLNVDGGFEMN